MFLKVRVNQIIHNVVLVETLHFQSTLKIRIQQITLTGVGKT